MYMVLAFTSATELVIVNINFENHVNLFFLLCFLVFIVTIPAAFFDRYFLWSFCSSSTLPRLVCFADVCGFFSCFVVLR